METQQPKRSSTPFEYFLYVAIVAETGLAALIYKVIFRDPDTAHLRIYFAIFYFAFLAWAITQLNLLHRDRNPPAPVEEQEQIVNENTPPVLGLTRVQLAIVIVVFATAVATFSCALRLLR